MGKLARPGFDLGLKLGEISKNKKYIGVVLGVTDYLPGENQIKNATQELLK